MERKSSIQQKPVLAKDSNQQQQQQQKKYKTRFLST